MRPEIDLAAALDTAAMESLESLAFLELAPAERAEGGDYLNVRIGLGKSGRMDLAISESLLEEVTCVLYNLEAGGIDEAVKRDALMEIINIVAGRFLALVSPEGFDLGLPALRPRSAERAPVDVERRLRAGPGAGLVLGYARAA